MRTRTRINEQVTVPVHNGQLVVTVDGQAPVGPSTFATTPWPVDNIYDEEYIADESNNLRGTKVVIHTKKRMIRQNIGSEAYRYGNTLYNSTGNNVHWWTHGLYGSNLSFGHIPTHYPNTEADLIRRTADDFYSSNEVDSLLNFVEAPQLVTGMRDFYGKVNLPVEPGTLTWKQKRARLRKGLSFLSGGFLYYSFGVAPLVSDMRKLSNQTAKLAGRLRNAAKRGGTDVSVHRRQVGRFSGISPDGSGSLPDGYGIDGALDGSKWHTQLYAAVMPTMICTIRGTREHRYQTSEFQKLDFLASRFGATGPASFAWERIPFSFVVDWFLDMSGVLNRIDNALTGSSKQIKDTSLSYKWECIVPMYKHKTHALATSSNDGVQTAVCTMSYYARKPVVANQLIDFSGRFGKKQATLSVALLTQLGANLRLKR